MRKVTSVILDLTVLQSLWCFKFTKLININLCIYNPLLDQVQVFQREEMQTIKVTETSRVWSKHKENASKCSVFKACHKPTI